MNELLAEVAATLKGAAGVIFIAGDRVLFLRRPDGSWGFPGGCTEDGETAYQTACREVLEETGHSIDPLAGQITQIAVVDNPDGYRFTCFMQCLPEVFPVTICSESDAMMWAAFGAFPSPLFMSSEALLTLALSNVAAIAMDERIVDGNGFTEIKGNPLSKVGVFPYLGKNIPGADPEKVFMVYRPPEELSDPATIDSIKLTPWVDDHAMLGDRAMPAEQKGVHGVIGQDVYFEGDTLYGNLKLFSATQGARIADGKRPLSLGYRCRFEHAPGVFNGQAYDYVQRHIRGNHLASVQDGRMGPEVAVLDHFCFTFDSKDVEIMADPEKKDDAPAGGGEMTIAELTATVKAIGPQLAALQQAMAALANPAAAAVVEDKKPEEATVTAAAMDAAIAKGVAEGLKSRALAGTLAQKLSAHVGVFDHSDKTHAEVVAYGLEKLGIKDAPKGQEAIYLDAYLAAKPVPGRGATAVAMDAADTKTEEVPAFLAGHGVRV